MWNITNVQEGTEEWMDLENRIRTYIRSMDITDPSVFGHTFPRHVWITDSGVIHYLLHGKEEEAHVYHTHGRFVLPGDDAALRAPHEELEKDEQVLTRAIRRVLLKDSSVRTIARAMKSWSKGDPSKISLDCRLPKSISKHVFIKGAAHNWHRGPLMDGAMKIAIAPSYTEDSRPFIVASVYPWIREDKLLRLASWTSS